MRSNRTPQRAATLAVGALAGLMVQLDWLAARRGAPYELHEAERLVLGPAVGWLALLGLRELVCLLLAYRAAPAAVARFRARFAWTLPPFLATAAVLAGRPLTPGLWAGVAAAWAALAAGLNWDAFTQAWSLRPWTSAHRDSRLPPPFRPAASPAAARMARWGWSGPVPAIALGSLAAQLALGWLSGTANDDLSVYYVRWGRELLEYGPADFYLHSNCDYTPVYVWLLAVGAALERLLGLESHHAVGLAYKLVPIACVFLLYHLGLRIWARCGARPAPADRLLLAGLILGNPALWYIAAVWGQSDTVLLCVIAWMLLALLEDRPTLALTLAFVGVLFKPQTAFALPFLFAWCHHRLPLSTLARATAAAVASGLALVAPFLVRLDRGWLIDFYRDTAAVFHLTSLNAGTLIGLLGGNMADDRAPSPLGPAYVDLGLALALGLFAFYFFALRHTFQSRDRPRLLFWFAFSLLASYYLSSRMHSRYLVYGLAFLAVWGAGFPAMLPARAIVLWGLSAALFWQMATHFPITVWPGFYSPTLNDRIPFGLSFYAYSLAQLLAFLWIARHAPGPPDTPAARLP